MMRIANNIPSEVPLHSQRTNPLRNTRFTTLEHLFPLCGIHPTEKPSIFELQIKKVFHLNNFDPLLELFSKHGEEIIEHDVVGEEINVLRRRKDQSAPSGGGKDENILHLHSIHICMR